MTTQQMTAQEEADELAKLFPEPVPFPIGSKLVIQIPTMDAAECAKFTRLARPLFEAFRNHQSANLDEFATVTLPEIVAEVAEKPESLFGALAVALRRSPEFVGALPPGYILALAVAVFKANIDFFAQTPGNLAAGVMAMVQEKASDSAGLTH